MTRAVCGWKCSKLLKVDTKLMMNEEKLRNGKTYMYVL